MYLKVMKKYLSVLMKTTLFSPFSGATRATTCLLVLMIILLESGTFKVKSLDYLKLKDILFVPVGISLTPLLPLEVTRQIY